MPLFVKQIPLVSIHAPVKGATGGKMTSKEVAEVSIHAPVKGATAQRLER